MSDLRDSYDIGWCDRCKRIVFMYSTLEERDRFAAEHDRSAHPSDTPPQTQFSRDLVKA